MYASPPGTPLRALSRLGAGCGWAVTLLLGCTVPRPFRESGLYGLAHALGQVTEGLALVGSAAGVCFMVWWAGEAWGASACRPTGWITWRSVGPRPARASAKKPDAPDEPRLRVGAGVAVAGLVGARAHLWEPTTVTLYALLAAVLVCGVVTDE